MLDNGSRQGSVATINHGIVDYTIDKTDYGKVNEEYFIVTKLSELNLVNIAPWLDGFDLYKSCIVSGTDYTLHYFRNYTSEKSVWKEPLYQRDKIGVFGRKSAVIEVNNQCVKTDNSVFKNLGQLHTGIYGKHSNLMLTYWGFDDSKHSEIRHKTILDAMYSYARLDTGYINIGAELDVSKWLNKSSLIDSYETRLIFIAMYSLYISC